MKQLTKIIIILVLLILTVTYIQTKVNEVQNGVQNQNNQSSKLNQTNQPINIPANLIKDVAILNLNKNWMAIVTFELPTPCHNVTFKGVEFKKNNINLFFEFTIPKNVCIQVVKQYNQTTSLGKLKNGNYSLNIFINGEDVWSRKFSV